MLEVVDDGRQVAGHERQRVHVAGRQAAAVDQHVQGLGGGEGEEEGEEKGEEEDDYIHD